MGNMRFRRGVRPVLAALLGLLLSAGLSPGQAADAHLAGSCDVAKTLGYCMEYRGADWTRQGAQDDCGTAPDGAFRVSPCPPADRVGVCSHLGTFTPAK